MHQSIATIDSPEFINLQPLEVNPLMSKCEIKVLYIGGNRNHSYITKEVATEMAKTLRGAPIVGYYKDSKEDFADHGEKVTFDDEGVHFECMTKPYGFVSPDAEVWFQKFEDDDDFGNKTVREYLMTTGFLWTGQFEECNSVINEGKPQSMELDEKTLDGYWSTDTKSNMDFFIINDAIFSKLCILGEDVEPCFEGANVTAPEVSRTFSLDDNFKNTLFNMMQDLKNFALNEGGKDMNEDVKTVDVEIEEPIVDEEPAVEIETPDADNSFAKKDEEDKDKKDEAEPKEEKKDEAEPKEEEKEDPAEEDKEKKKAKHSLEEPEQDLAAELELLQAQFSELEAVNKELQEFKNAVESQKKDELIGQFYMLSDEDKKDVIENKDKYSYDDIEAKLSVICVRKKVNFDLDDTDKNENKVEEKVMTYNLQETESSTPAWINALKNARNKNI